MTNTTQNTVKIISKISNSFLTLLSGFALFAGLIFLSAAQTAQAQQPDPSQGPIEIIDGAAPPAPHPPRKATGAPVVGRKAAEKYMGAHAAPQDVREGAAPSTGAGERREIGAQLAPSDHYLAVHFGGFISDSAYRWGQDSKQSNVGDETIGLTYRVGEWRNSMDLTVRVDYTGYGLSTGTASKLSFLPLITFPDASSRFPLYFGVGAGVGVFTHNVAGESALSIDYQLLLGARFFEIFQNTGFFIEAGIKNHFLILTSGQFNGTFIAAGPVFTF